MGILSDIGNIAGPVFDFFGSRAANNANLQAGIEATKARERDRAATRAMYGGVTGNRVSSFNAAGGLDTRFLSGSGPDVLQQGDVGRAGRVNDLGNNFNFTLPNLDAAKAVIGERDARGQERFDRLGANLINSNRRAIGPGNSGLSGSTTQALSEFSQQNRLNSGPDAIELLGSSNADDLNNLLRQIQANQAQAPTLTSPASGAATIMAQLPSIPARADLSGAILPGVASGAISDARDREREAANRIQENKLFAAILAQNSRPSTTKRGLLDQSGFVDTSSVTI
jgi:hypothetical protein